MEAVKKADYSSLLNEAKQRLKLCSSIEGFDTGNVAAERMLIDLQKFPHHFVLACLMDRQIRAHRAWVIPYAVGSSVGKYDFATFETLSLNQVDKIFHRERLHRFNSKMARIFYLGVKRIREVHDGDAKNIWAGKPSCAQVIRKFLEFDGGGLKIATMATNILFRQFKVPLKDCSAIDISPDVQTMKFFQHRGLLRKGAKKEELIYLAREISPKYPGLLDLVAWEGGRDVKRQSAIR